ncbi:MAG: hypothetical protein R3B53_02900 [Candidatus Paceibacterota bacterium]
MKGMKMETVVSSSLRMFAVFRSKLLDVKEASQDQTIVQVEKLVSFIRTLADHEISDLVPPSVARSVCCTIADIIERIFEYFLKASSTTDQVHTLATMLEQITRMRGAEEDGDRAYALLCLLWTQDRRQVPQELQALLYSKEVGISGPLADPVRNWLDAFLKKETTKPPPRVPSPSVDEEFPKNFWGEAFLCAKSALSETGLLDSRWRRMDSDSVAKFVSVRDGLESAVWSKTRMQIKNYLNDECDEDIFEGGDEGNLWVLRFDESFNKTMRRFAYVDWNICFVESSRLDMGVTEDFYLSAFLDRYLAFDDDDGAMAAVLYPETVALPDPKDALVIWRRVGCLVNVVIITRSHN